MAFHNLSWLNCLRGVMFIQFFFKVWRFSGLKSLKCLKSFLFLVSVFLVTVLQCFRDCRKSAFIRIFSVICVLFVSRLKSPSLSISPSLSLSITRLNMDLTWTWSEPIPKSEIGKDGYFKISISYSSLGCIKEYNIRKPPTDCLSVLVIKFSGLLQTALPCQWPDKMPYDSVEQINAMCSRKTDLTGFAGILQLVLQLRRCCCEVK